MPHLVLGTALVLVCALAAVVLSVRAGGRVPVLALARDMPAGEVITSADLRVVQVAAGDVATVSADQEAAVVGQPLTVPRPAGTLLSPDDVGSVNWPPPGRAIAAVALPVGAFPPGLTAGAKVAAVVSPETAAVASRSPAGGTKSGGAADARSSWLPGTVVSVLPDGEHGGDASWGTSTGGVGEDAEVATGAVVSLLMDENSAAAIGAAAAGTVRLVQLSMGADDAASGTGG